MAAGDQRLTVGQIGNCGLRMLDTELLLDRCHSGFVVGQCVLIAAAVRRQSIGDTQLMLGGDEGILGLVRPDDLERPVEITQLAPSRRRSPRKSSSAHGGRGTILKVCSSAELTSICQELDPPGKIQREKRNESL